MGINLTPGFKSDIFFCLNGFTPMTSVKEEYSYMYMYKYIHIYYQFTFYKYSEGGNMFCDRNTRNQNLVRYHTTSDEINLGIEEA